MTDAAAIAATFADAKIVKTRSTLQIILELPIEQADAALKALGGVPQPGRERPVAVALLSPLVVEKSGTAAADTSVRAGASGDQITSGPLAATPAAPTQPPEETPKAPAKQRHAGAASQDKVVARAAILCGDHNFQDWLWALPASDGRQQNEDIDEWTARELRHRCGVKSRRDLAIDGDARKRFLALVERYEMDTGRRAERRSA